MGDNKRFVPVRGTEEKIAASVMGFNDGYLYFATDTGHIYLDYIDEDGRQVARAMVGGAIGGDGNIGVYYANKSLSNDEKLETSIIFPIDTIEGKQYPNKNDLIINIPEGSFYRVVAPSPLTSSVTANRLTIAGGGGGASTLAEDIDLIIDPLDTVNLINDSSQLVYFTATSAKNAKGREIDSRLTITYTLAYTDDGINYITYKTDKFMVDSGIKTSLDFGKYAKKSSTSRLTLKASQNNAEGTISRYFDFTTSNLTLSLPQNFSNSSYYLPNQVILQCNAVGEMDKIVEYYFDDEYVPFFIETLSINDSAARSVDVSSKGVNITHGAHKVWIRLFQSINGEKGAEVEPLVFEIAVYDGSSQKPIIWLGDYKELYYNYDVIQIPFYAFDPATSTPKVYFKKNNVELDNSPQEIKNSGSYSYFEIANAEMDILNRYTISCGEGENETIRSIEFTVLQDPNRTDFGVQKKEFLTYELNTVGSGRSNNESLSKRQTLSYEYEINGEKRNINAVFSNFNWYNNGWVRDEENGNKTCLRISNGARLSIPIGETIFANSSGNAATDLSHTIELCFKIRNVQDYSALIHNITRYKNDSALYEAFYTDETGYKTSYTNYDSFLAWYLKENHIDFVDKDTNETRDLTYDDLEFDYIQKQINLSNVVCGYYSGDTKSVTGLCLGPQDAFFSNGTNTVSVPYVEDQIVSLSVVYQYSQVPAQNLIYIYLNGVLTSVIKNTRGAFTIESDNMVFNSTYCDIDLYKVRVYRTALNVNDIVMNYAADFENVKIYDQNKLAEEDRSINEYRFSYDNMIRYNTNHPNAPLMPYVIFDTSDSNNGDRLSYAKSVNVPIKMEFVNTGLELAYASGELEELARADGLWDDNSTAEEKAAAVAEYYKHHCPSFVGYNVNMAVQGTSSEFYPRRNYKIKTKTDYDEDQKSRVHIFLNRGPFAEAYAADQRGLTQSKYILSTGAYDSNLKYYLDKNGATEVTFDLDNPYRYDTYYIENPQYVKLGNEKTRQSFWYMNNYNVGTTKFTMKIDYMESSGTYNMGFANLINNGYTKHPIEDYNKAGAFVYEDANKTSYVRASNFKEGITYYYMTHKGAWKPADGSDEPIIIHSAEDFAKTPLQLWLEQVGPAKIKILVSQAEGAEAGIEETITNAHNESGIAESELLEYAGGWYEITAGYSDLDITNINEYRTSVSGFRTLAFHKKSDGTYQYIGLYNLLLDKGSDEVYGFKLDKTADKPALQKFVKNKTISKVAECWEFENNNRTFCSFKDPLKRKDLSFDVYTMEGNRKVPVLNSVRSVPVVADSFEYRYHSDGDILDYVIDPVKEADKYEEEGGDVQSYMAKNNVDLLFNKDDISQNQEARSQFLLNTYKNWEKACQWVWNTCTDYVISQGEYNKINVGLKLWIPDTFYIYDVENNTYFKDIGNEYDINTIYYELNNGKYVNAYVVDNYIFNNETKYNYYTIVNNNYAPCTTNDTFNESIDYYILNNFTDEELAIREAANECDRLVIRCKDTDIFDSNEIYYTYDGTKPNGFATTKVDNLTEEEFNANKTNYYIGTTITYRNRQYKYDTKEYRADKFVNELSKHFDIEYMATYFVMTEVFECYDSRGKNCMMASWGPQEKDGDYIWYPIFYDIDTQLGVNNTGIPSFEYNVDATEAGNYSTSDSVLWNNFYKYFKSSAIIGKYKNLRGVDSMFTKLKNPPIRTVDYIESWYNTDPDVCDSIAMRGERPLIARNLDEYYKYITITNNASYENGITGHIQSDTSGTWTYDSEGKYFYMLQGDRSLSRQQFLNNRLDYIDSWLNQGNYQRGGANRIRGRVAANNSNKTSDIWLEPRDGSYYDENGDKRYLFDAEYWLTLTPTHSSYVTLGDDNEAYPSQKYDGIYPLRFEISAIESGVRTSQNYPEQLLYIYGLDQMKDLGDMSKLYWQEFAIEGEAKKLTSLKLGYDGLMENPEGGDPIAYKNNNVNQPTIPAGQGALGMPLLKEINLCNMQINSGSGDPTLDLRSCEKLENFRATGSNYIDIQFADGVALNTVYLPTSLKILKLTEARLLKNLITEYHAPELNNEGNLVAEPGLYLQGMFENNSTNISTINIIGGGLGYDSYKLLKKFYDIRRQQTSQVCDITMTNVAWSPFELVNSDEEYNSIFSYYEDDGHYGLQPYSYNVNNWAVKTLNGEIYRLTKTLDDINVIQISDISMLEEFITNNVFRTDKDNLIPTITGIIYVANDEPVDEFYIRNEIQTKYPHLKFFFKTVTPAYTARFLLMDADEGIDGGYKIIGEQTIKDGWFINPIDLYGDISREKANHDFYGWAKDNSSSAPILVNLDRSIDDWGTQELKEDVFTYYFYAICKWHKWKVHFMNGDSEFCTMDVEHSQTISGPDVLPIKNDDPVTPELTHQLLGYSRSQNATVPMNLEDFPIFSDTIFYTVWNSELIDVHNDIHPEYFTKVKETTDGVEIKLNVKVIGKLTIPKEFDGQKVIAFSSNTKGKVGNARRVDSNLLEVTHVFIEKNDNGKVNLKAIENETFFECINLRYFEFADGLEQIGAAAFQGVQNLRDSTSIEYVKTISANAFTNAFKFDSDRNLLYISGSLTSIGSEAFSNFLAINDNNLESHYRIQMGSADNPFTVIDSIPVGNQKTTPRGGMIFRGNNRKVLSIELYVNGPSPRIQDAETTFQTLFGLDLTREDWYGSTGNGAETLEQDIQVIGG